MGDPVSRTRRVARSITLLRACLGASIVILSLGAIVIADRTDAALRGQAISDEVNSMSLFADTVLSPSLVRGDRLVAKPSKLVRFGQTVRLPEEMRSVSVWTRDGTLVLSSATPAKIGARVPPDDGLRDLFAEGRAYGSIIDLRNDVDERETANARPGHDRMLDAYAPIRGRSGTTIGAYEIYVETTRLDAAVAASRRSVWLTVGGVFFGLVAALTLLVSGASRRLRRQAVALSASSRELEESYALLEQSSLEAIESLNATVEAKDPYTAGHSQRVREIALTVGRKLGLDADRLEALGMSALFHDIGKIGVPDAILTKPAKLTPDEFELAKEHARRGAEIVSKLSRLQGTVAAIRHHHERWDGTGYPEGLAGEEIPLEASIVGIADAWDAMTTARPYAAPLSEEASLEQIRAGRGTQFRPEVVDAFMAARHVPAPKPVSLPQRDPVAVKPAALLR